jgi:hypothetical protein
LWSSASIVQTKQRKLCCCRESHRNQQYTALATARFQKETHLTDTEE